MSKKYVIKISVMDNYINLILEEVKEIVHTVLEEFAEETVQELVVRAKSEVYNVYEPEYYIRRWTLVSPSSYDVQIDESNKKVSVSITPIAEFNRSHGGWNYGNELGGFMNFGNYWHGYVINYNVPMPRPYLSNYADEGNTWDKLYMKLESKLGDLMEYVYININVGE